MSGTRKRSEGKSEMQQIIQQWDDNGDDKFGRFDNLVDALWAAGYRKDVATRKANT